MRRPRLLDLFCKAGGAAMGYSRAGFDVVGVDIEPQPRYPFEFVQADALEILAAGRYYRYDWTNLMSGFAGLGHFDAIHASPPCQAYSRMRHLPWLKGRKYPMLIPAVLAALEETGLPWVVENVEDAHPEFKRHAGVVLCGTMFGLKVYRHRLFASNVMLFAPPHEKHATVIGKGRMLNDRAKPNADGWVSLPSKETFADSMARYKAKGICPAVGDGGYNPASVAGPAMGIDWMSGKELSQAIPPAYTEFLGRQLLAALGSDAS